VTAFSERDDLFNQRSVFDNKIHSTDFGAKVKADIHRRWVALGAYRYRMVNDSNRQNIFGIGNLVYVFFEPKRLTVDVRFDFQDWKRSVTDYWSPQNFWHVSATVHWRQYLNRDGMYFGARNAYYGLKYRFQIDRDLRPFNGGAIEAYRDWNSWFATGAEFFGNYSSVYNDVGGIAYAVIRF